MIEQRGIGWQQFLEGLISIKLSSYQHQYLINTESKRSIQSWCTRLIKNGWTIITTIWESRNNQLHTPDILNKLEGLDLLNKAIEKEWDHGLGKLPILEFSHFFRLKKDTLRKKTVEAKKDWLATVKMARELYKDITEEDQFDSNNALREWIGLDRAKKEKRTINDALNAKNQ